MNISQEQFEKVCRLCATEKNALVSIFGSSNNIEYDIPSKIMACAEVKVYDKDNLPSKVCFNCLNNLKLFYDFQAVCKKSDALFRNILQKAQTDKKPLEPEENGSRKSTRLKQKYDDNFNNREPTPMIELKEKRSYIRRRPLKLHPCELCDKILKTRSDWHRHVTRHHGIQTKPSRKRMECSVCEHTFASWKLLKEHQRDSGHTAKETCQHCGKTFSRSYMSEHLRTHTGEQPFLCTTCGKHYWIQSIFKKHTERCANMEKKFKCSYCDGRFYNSFSLKVHERIHTKEKPYVCEKCGKAFRLKSKLTVHQNTHTDVRPHPCLTCGQKFRQRTHLKEHLRIHTGIKPYICDICGAAFTQGHSLKTHQMKHATSNQTQ